MKDVSNEVEHVTPRSRRIGREFGRWTRNATNVDGYDPRAKAQGWPFVGLAEILLRAGLTSREVEYVLRPFVPDPVLWVRIALRNLDRWE